MSYPIEAKCVGGREPLEVIIARYQPQMQWQMMVTGAKKCALSVIMGADEPVVEYIPFDQAYADELMKRAVQFMRCVETLTPPVALPPVEAPVIIEKIYQMDGNPDWCQQADRWLQTEGAMSIARESEKLLKGLVPADAKRCTGHGISITRNRAGAMSLRKENGEKQ